MASLNRVTIIGHLGKDPEVRTFQNGGRVCNLSVATSERWKDKNGEAKEKTEWHRVVLLSDGLVRIAEQYLKKGAAVYLEGQLETREYEKDGIKRYATEVVLRPYKGVLKLLDKAPGLIERAADELYAFEQGHDPLGEDDDIPY